MAGRLEYESVRAMRDMQSPRGIGEKTLTFGGKVYPYLPGRSDFSRIMGAGGFGQEVSIVFLVERALFTEMPKSRQPLTDNVDGRRYKIASVAPADDDSHYVLACVDIAQSL